MKPVVPELLSGFTAVARWPKVSAAVCIAVADGSWSSPLSVAAICSAAHLPLMRQGDVDALLKAGAAHALFRQHSPMNWSPLAEKAIMEQLALMLQGASFYLESIHQESDQVEVVLTKPSRPSELERALRNSGYELVGLVATTEMFPAMAVAANAQFSVMTPFLDVTGAEVLVDLFARCEPYVERRLILRSSTTGLPDGYLAAVERLQQLGVNVFDYRLEREMGGFETFHAKVLLADRDWAYVGSTNMTQWSLAHSMELGVSLKGRASARIARVVDAVTQIAKRLS
jgi:hypothetical protein